MLPEGQQLSHYQLVRLLKSGGMGEVYLAVDTLLHRQVAIKVIHTDFMHDAEYGAAEEAMRLFLREAQAIAQLDQINILPLYDSGKEHINQALLMYMVMPYRYLGSLKDWLQAHQEQEPLPLAAVERIVTQAAFALQHAHDRQIIHQDVKPSNFLVHGDAEHPSRLNLQLADFGVAKFMMKTSEKSLIVRGTPNYMAPEQWEGQPVPATDQYALAVMAYELLTGRLPFEGNGYQNMWHQHSYVEPTPPSMINPVLPKELDGVLLRALAKKPGHRYSSVSAFAQAFTRAVVNSGNVYQTHVISVLEARNGTNRVLILPNGKQGTLPIPPGAYNGQVIRLEGYGKPTTYNGTLGALILTIVVAEVDGGVSPADVTVQQKFATPVMQSEISPTLPAVSSRRGQVRGSAILKMCLALVLLLGMASLFYFSVSRAISPLKGNTTATAVYATQAAATTTEVACPSYLPGCGTLALYDPLRDDSKGYDWHPPDYSGCDFLGGALHVSVNGDEANPVFFHACIGKTPTFSDFTYEIKMTFIKGDCGGVIFRSHDPMLYYFYICQDGEYGIVRYTRDPDNGMPDPNLNPPLRTSATRSSSIIAGSSQANIIAVQARGSIIDLYVNQHLIDSVEDNGYRDGTIGVLAKALDLYRPTEVAFSDARVWTF
jgi:eukaryotic-like serine/threonine-protein kinase